MKPNFSVSYGLIRINQIHTGWKFELIGFIRINRIHSDWKFGLILINSDCPDSFGLQVRIDFEWASDWFGLKTNFRLDRNETVWRGFKFRNDSENSDWFGINFNFETFARAIKSKQMIACLFSIIRVHWRKFRIEIHFEPIRNFPNHSRICIRTKQFHSGLIQS